MKKTELYVAPHTNVVSLVCYQTIVCASSFTGSVNESLDETDESTEDIIFGW